MLPDENQIKIFEEAKEKKPKEVDKASEESNTIDEVKSLISSLEIKEFEGKSINALVSEGYKGIKN